MYIEPNSVIRVLRNVPLDNTYEHTIYFASKVLQQNYFMSLTAYSFTQQTYQRVQNNKMRVQRNANDLYNCNYVMFQNTSYGDKWFYAFILGVEYINNATAEITFEIDVMQTWHFDYNLGQCFVEREHSVRDDMYGNLVEENLECGQETVATSVDNIDLNRMNVAMLVGKYGNNALSGSVYNNVYTPLDVRAGISASDTRSLDYAINQVVDAGGENAIVAIYQYPAVLGDTTATSPYTTTKTITQNTANINGYVPKNKKLFSYPYSSIIVSNNSGQTAQYKWELWGTKNQATFAMHGVLATVPSCFCYPTNYRGISNDYDSGITLNSFPQCAWTGDAFKAWWAQNKNSVTTSLVAGAITGAVGLGLAAVMPVGAAGAMAGASYVTRGALAATGVRTVTHTASNVATALARVNDLQNTPAQVHGQSQMDSMNAGIGRIKYTFYSMTIRAEYAKIIDEYFNVYGYATKRVKVPNTSARPFWNYTKTSGCVIHGSVPADDAKAICHIYDSGITFWRDGAYVGNYTLNNAPV